MREKMRQQSHEIEILEDKVGQLRWTNKEIKRKIVTLQHQQDDQTSLMTQQIEIQREMQSDIKQFFYSYEGKKAGHQMVVSKQLNYFSRTTRLIKNVPWSRSKLSYFEGSVSARSNNMLLFWPCFRILTYRRKKVSFL